MTNVCYILFFKKKKFVTFFVLLQLYFSVYYVNSN